MFTGWLKLVYLKCFSQPAQDRLVYRKIDEGQIRSITEIGMGQGLRTHRMLDIALRHHAPDQVRYAAFDLFESRPAGRPGLTLKLAHRLLTARGIQVRLVPGEILAGLVRTANSLPATDLVVISGEFDFGAMEPAWLYFPRMLHENSLVLFETGSVRSSFQLLSYAQVCELAARASSARRQAA